MNRSLNILVVEDAANIRAIIELSLQLDPLIAVRTAATGAEALEIVAHGIIVIDLLLLDGTLTDMSGLGLMAALANAPKTSDLPIVILTATRHAPEIERYRAAGALAILAKPFDPLTLAHDVRTLLVRHRQGAQA